MIAINPQDIGEIAPVYHSGAWERFKYTPLRSLITEVTRQAAKIVPFTLPLQTRTFWGRRMNIHLPEVVSARIYRYGLFEPELCSAFCRLIKPGSTFFDVGAHFGFFSLLASDLGASVHSFEPTPSTYKVLSSNVGALGAKTNHMAVWNEECTIDIHDFGVAQSAFNSLFSVMPGGILHNVPAIRIDEYVRRTGATPNVIKIDAEHVEYQILQGMQETMATHRPIISIEVSDSPHGHTSRDTLEFASSLDYALMEWGHDGLKRHDLKTSYCYDNIILVPQEQNVSGIT